MSTDGDSPAGPADPTDLPPPSPDNSGGRLVNTSIEDELKDSYLTYAMSVIVSRALPDVRDGLKPSQRRILVAMNDLNLGPGAGRIKCAKISGDTRRFVAPIPSASTPLRATGISAALARHFSARQR